MKLSTSLNITNKSFTKRDIKTISRFIYKEFEELNDNIRYSIFTFTVICDDNITYSSENSLEVLEDGNILDIQKINEIRIEVISHVTDIPSHIYLNLKAFPEEFNNSIFEISGDKKWVTNVFEDIKSIFNSVKPQNTMVKDYKYIVILLLSFSLGSLILVFLRFLVDGITEFLLNINFVANLFITVLLGFFSGSFSLYEKILSLYPKIEFDFGPEHFNLVKKKRNIVIFSFVTIILSIVSNIIYSFI